jgi:hypothetical protein
MIVQQPSTGAYRVEQKKSFWAEADRWGMG